MKVRSMCCEVSTVRPPHVAVASYQAGKGSLWLILFSLFRNADAPYVSVAAGAYHSAGIHIDGELSCFGKQEHGDPAPYHRTTIPYTCSTRPAVFNVWTTGRNTLQECGIPIRFSNDLNTVE